jgi:hypothetical protein
MPSDPHTTGASGADTSGTSSPGAGTGGGTWPGPDVSRPTSPGAGSTDPYPVVPGTTGAGAATAATPGATPGTTGSHARTDYVDDRTGTDYPDTGYAAGATGVGRSPAAGQHGDPSDLSLGELFAEVSRDLSTLVRQEVELAKAEATTSAKRAGKGAGMLGGAGYAGHLTVLFLSIALWWGLGALIGRGWSALVVAVIWGIVAAVLYSRGRKELDRTPGMPQTADTVKKIPNAVRGNEEKNR